MTGILKLSDLSYLMAFFIAIHMKIIFEIRIRILYDFTPLKIIGYIIAWRTLEFSYAFYGLK